MNKIKTHIKKYKIRYSYLIMYTGYTKVHISRVLNEKAHCSERFLTLILNAIEKHSLIEWNDLQNIVKDIKKL
jgi:hypothetical protein